MIRCVSRSTIRSVCIATALILLVVACGGLDPGELPAESFISGNITYVGGTSTWPDTAIQVLVIAFEQKPLTVTDVGKAILEGKAVVSDQLPTRVDTCSYSFKVTGVPRTFRYVVVAMQDGANIFYDWLLLSVHSPTNDPEQPGIVTVDPGERIEIDFTVDFANLPPQPIQ